VSRNEWNFSVGRRERDGVYFEGVIIGYDLSVQMVKQS